MKAKAIVLVLGLALLMSHSALADVPDEITYQGRLLYNGSPVTTATSVVFRLYQASSGGSAVWTETHGSVAPDSNGIYTIVLGETVAVPDDYDALWLELEVAGNTLTPRKKLTSAPFVLRAGELSDLYVSGNVGIGIDAPWAKVHLQDSVGTAYNASSVAGQLGGNTLLVENRYYTPDLNSFAQIALKVSGDSGASFARIVAMEPGQAQSDLAVVLRDSSAQKERLRIKGHTGNVGIGTTSPDSKLHVVSDAPLRLTRDVSGTMYGINTLIDSARFIFNGVGPSPASDILALRHDTGNVGIGTNTPGAKLHIVQTSGGSDGGIRWTDGSAELNMYGDASGHFHFDASSGFNLGLQANGGNVGVQNTLPNSPLQVGSIAASGSQYLQIDAEGAPPGASDCDEFAETGRMIFDYSYMRIWICGGTSGWRYVSTTQ